MHGNDYWMSQKVQYQECSVVHSLIPESWLREKRLQSPVHLGMVLKLLGYSSPQLKSKWPCNSDANKIEHHFLIFRDLFGRKAAFWTWGRGCRTKARRAYAYEAPGRWQMAGCTQAGCFCALFGSSQYPKNEDVSSWNPWRVSRCIYWNRSTL